MFATDVVTVSVGWAKFIRPEQLGKFVALRKEKLSRIGLVASAFR
jgi:hypothetical protein